MQHDQKSIQEDRASFRVLTTAGEAWPAFENAVLDARSEVLAGFRIFDLATRLRSPRGREIGHDWFDLLADALMRGVRVNLTISDFDPVMATELHRLTWRSMRQAAALAEAVGPEAATRLRVRPHMHPARAGIVPRMAFAIPVLGKMLQKRKQLRPEVLRREAPGLGSGQLPFQTTSHHQKIAVIDEEVLYVGGLDLNERRWDTLEHEREADQTWSDIQVVLRDPDVAAQAAQHLREFTEVTEGLREPSPLPRLLRTLSCPRRLQAPYLSPRTLLKEIEEAHLEAFGQAEHLIHIETQFMRSSPIADGLVGAAKTNPEVRLIMVLPGLPDDVAFEGNTGVDARFGIGRARHAIQKIFSAYGDRAVIAVPVRPTLVHRESDASLAGSPLIHVHNKLLVIDDKRAIIGSGNLNGRSMRWDTEVALNVKEAERVEQFRTASRRHWWDDGAVPEHAWGFRHQFDWWKPEIRRNSVRLPENRSGFLVLFNADNHAEMAQDLPGVTENIV